MSPPLRASLPPPLTWPAEALGPGSHASCASLILTHSLGMGCVYPLLTPRTGGVLKAGTKPKAEHRIWPVGNWHTLFSVDRVTGLGTSWACDKCCHHHGLKLPGVTRLGTFPWMELCSITRSV